MVTANGTDDSAPGESWDFETDATDGHGVDGAAYTTAAVPN